MMVINIVPSTDLKIHYVDFDTPKYTSLCNVYKYHIYKAR